MRDFSPPDYRLQKWLFSEFHSASRRHNFQEYTTPVLESLDLYKRKAGDEVTKQLYSMTDFGDRPLALRPEMTPSLARLFIKEGGNGELGFGFRFGFGLGLGLRTTGEKRPR